LAERTLEEGNATAQRLDAPSAGTGVMIWQGVLEDEKDIARIQVPIPADWLGGQRAYLRLIVACDHRLTPRSNISGPQGTSPQSRRCIRRHRRSAHRGSSTWKLPVLERLYDLRKLPQISLSRETLGLLRSHMSRLLNTMRQWLSRRNNESPSLPNF